MASVIVAPKQIATNNAYFITLATFQGVSANAQLLINLGEVDTPQFSTSPLVYSAGPVSTTLATAGAILRDMGQNVFSSGSVFRKVQLLQYSAAGNVDTALTGGVAGDDNATPFLTSYIVLPGLQGASAPTPENVDGTPVVPSKVARLG